MPPDEGVSLLSVRCIAPQHCRKNENAVRASVKRRAAERMERKGTDFNGSGPVPKKDERFDEPLRQSTGVDVPVVGMDTSLVSSCSSSHTDANCYTVGDSSWVPPSPRPLPELETFRYPDSIILDYDVSHMNESIPKAAQPEACTDPKSENSIRLRSPEERKNDSPQLDKIRAATTLDSYDPTSDARPHSLGTARTVSTNQRVLETKSHRTRSSESEKTKQLDKSTTRNSHRAPKRTSTTQKSRQSHGSSGTSTSSNGNDTTGSTSARTMRSDNKRRHASKQEANTTEHVCCIPIARKVTDKNRKQVRNSLFEMLGMK